MTMMRMPFMHMAAACMPVALAAARHGEIGREGNISTRPSIERWNGAYHHGRIEDMIVEGKIIGGDVANPLLLLKHPVFGAQPGGGFEKFRFGNLSGPEAFKRELQFAMTADPRETERCDWNGLV
ncbi:hypothetical protein D3C72_1334600 [compost metagenome]